MSKFSKKDVFYLSIIALLVLTIIGMRFMPQKAPEQIIYNHLGNVDFYQEPVTEASAESAEETAPDSEEDVPANVEEAPDQPAEPSPAPKQSSAPKAPAKIKPGEPKININTASQAQLERLPGVGEATAKKIIEYRAQSGGFANISDIKKVSGIGAKKYEAMKDFIEI